MLRLQRSTSRVLLLGGVGDGFTDGTVEMICDGYSRGYPTDEYLARVGISRELSRHLASLNDDARYCFTEIARYIDLYIPEDD